MELWQRFSQEVRRAVLVAHDNARTRGESTIAAEQLLLGLLAAEDCTAVQLLRQLKVDTRRLSEAVERQLGEAPGGGDPAEVTFTLGAQRVITRTYQEAQAEGEELVGTEHLLLGLLRERGGAVPKAFAACGVRLREVREAIAAGRE